MNYRKTIQQKLVFDAVRDLACHATAEEIFNKISAAYPAISKGTVYRNLDCLVARGEIRRIEVPGGADHYDHLCEGHYHVICVKCHKVFDVDMEPIPSLKDKIENTNGFDFIDCDILFKGICPSCKEKASEDRSNI